MIVVAGVHQVGGKRLPSPALIALDNHGSQSGRRRVVGRREAKGANEHVADHADVVASLFQRKDRLEREPACPRRQCRKLARQPLGAP
jgi:hypothetical protein